MKLFKLSLMVLFLYSSGSYALNLKLYEKEKYKDVAITEFQGAKISSSCIKNEKAACKAWTAFAGKSAKRSKAVKELLGNPAALYCADLKSMNRILKDETGNQYDYCIFDDGSMVDSWSIYNKHFGS